MYLYIKALHIIFAVTWFSGLFYIVRLFVYAREAHDLPEPGRITLLRQYMIMQKRLWYGITWPSAIITLIFGCILWYQYGMLPAWLLVKLLFVAGLFLYHLTIHRIFQQQQKLIFVYSSQKLRLWNEVATIFLIAIVILAVVKQTLSLVWGLAGLVVFTILLLAAIRIYKNIRESE